MDLFFRFFLPNIAFASTNGLDSFIVKVNKLIINPLILLLFALALLFFLYGLVEFISNQDNEESRTKGKNHILWSVIGIVIMMGVWTIMNMIMDTFEIKGIDPEKGEVELK